MAVAVAVFCLALCMSDASVQPGCGHVSYISHIAQRLPVLVPQTPQSISNIYH